MISRGNDILTQAVFVALTAAADVHACLQDCLDDGVFSPSFARRARELVTEIERRTIFGTYSTQDFRNFAEDLERPISEETRSGYVADEHHVSGGYVETHVTRNGENLVGLRSALKLLLRRLQEVELCLAAEQVVAELRE